MPASSSTSGSFLQSSLTEDNCFQSTDTFKAWFKSMESAYPFTVQQIPFDKLDNWSINASTGDFEHATGKFFKIHGIRVRTDFNHPNEWDQPIIDQPEIGILGIITKVLNGVRYFLMQSKMEPGNININQLAPTVQATKSNYTQAHQGKLPDYLKFFLDRSKVSILVNQLQAEQGSRFLRKKNLNIIIEVHEDIPVLDNFCWLTLGQIKQLLKIDNLVAMDTRSVISKIPLIDSQLRGHLESTSLHTNNSIDIFDHKVEGFHKDLLASMIDSKHALHDSYSIINWITDVKTKYEMHVEKIPLNSVDNWIHTERDIHHETGKFFSVIAVSTHASNREIGGWTQPILKHFGFGVIGFVVKKINGVLHLLVQGKAEPGNIDIVEMGPTVSCSDAEYRLNQPEKPLFLDMFMNASPDNVKYSAIQSEEGGRFYQWQNKNMIVEIAESEEIEIPDYFIWMTLKQIMDFTRYNNYLNMEAMNILSCLSLI